LAIVLFLQWQPHWVTLLPISDLLTADISDDSDEESDADVENTGPLTIRVERRERKPAKRGKHGIELKPCRHVFCGVRLSLQCYVE
jgi:hypothetical protein